MFFCPCGHHEAAWRHPDSEPHRLMDIDYYISFARQVEAARFDAIFFADSVDLPKTVRFASRLQIEPLTWLSAIAATTSRVGLIATASTTYSEPYNLARLFASLDHLSKGRAGWNIVTTQHVEAAGNFGLPAHPPHSDRYRRATEFIDVVSKLWDSWEDEALVVDSVSGMFADTDRIHGIEYSGEFFSVAGPLNTPRTPQGRPVYVQAGSSDDGRAFAARHAEAVFTAQPHFGGAKAFYADIKRLAARAGRSPDEVLILPGMSPVIGSTEAEAKARQRELDELIQPEHMLGTWNKTLGVELTAADLDRPFPVDSLDMTGERGASGRVQVIVDLVRRERLTARQLMQRLAHARGHWALVGTPEQVADNIELWFKDGAADGFNVMPHQLPTDFALFAEFVLPILQARGLFRTEYSGTTLREHYGLARPRSRYSVEPVLVD
ncbi:LLM class flavin-dependent oxidoreductase [Streptomyces sp. NL15-2K]|uniref:LLM class flavin-dependent oxidoreductase n=1 Tax=Streptomyces sp. NL15-2K TaxID=376149 RepID=UPI000F5665A2|nr:MULTISPECIES: LLM class flavin-dependent oxidoreductase [Actinomycetes]WKX15987.1 LLM class flavin-dependent oxidoreductase [Kutzneria buriramensis]